MAKVSYRENQVHPFKVRQRGQGRGAWGGEKKRLHRLSLSKYRKSLKEMGKNTHTKENLEIQFFNFVSLFLTAAGCYLHTYHHLCFFTRENIPASLGTFAQAVRNKYLQLAGISSSWALHPDSNPCVPLSSLSSLGIGSTSPPDTK